MTEGLAADDVFQPCPDMGLHPRPQRPQRELQAKGQGDAEADIDQGHGRALAHNLVVDGHDRQRHGDGQPVHERGEDHGLHRDAAEAAHGIREPVG